MQHLKNLLDNSKFLLLADQALFSGTSFFLTLFIARSFSTEQFGIYSLWLIGIYFVLNLISTIGIQQYQVLFPELGKKEGYTVFNVALFLFIIALINLTVFGILVPLLPIFEVIAEYKYVLLVFASGFLLHDFFRRLALANLNVKLAFVIDLSYAAIVGIIAMTQVFFDLTFGVFTGLLAISYLPSALGGLYEVRATSFTVKNWKEFAKKHWLHGKWLIVSAMVQWWSSNLFVLASGLYIGIEALGAFRLVQSLFGLLNVCLQAIENHAIPTAAKIYNEYSIPKTISFLNNLSYKTVLFFGLILSILFVFASPLLVAAVGEKYQEYGFVVRGMVLLYAIIITGYPIRIGIRILLLNRQHLIGYSLSLIVSFISFNFLLEHFQLMGAIAGLIFSQIILLSFWYISLFRQKFYLWKSYI